MICALNKMPLAGMPESVLLASRMPIQGTLYSKSDLFNKAVHNMKIPPLGSNKLL